MFMVKQEGPHGITNEPAIPCNTVFAHLLKNEQGVKYAMENGFKIGNLSGEHTVIFQGDGEK